MLRWCVVVVLNVPYGVSCPRDVSTNRVGVCVCAQMMYCGERFILAGTKLRWPCRVVGASTHGIIKITVGYQSGLGRLVPVKDALVQWYNRFRPCDLYW